MNYPDLYYDPSGIRLTKRTKDSKQTLLEEYNSFNAGASRTKDWLEWIEEDSQLNPIQKLCFMFKAGYETGVKKAQVESQSSNGKENRFGKLKNVIKTRWRTILIVAILTTAFNWFAPFYTYNHTASGGWSRINRLSGHVQFYHPGYGWQ